MLADLVYDVGMHNGKDTAAFLAERFRVVAIEANPAYAAAARAQFAEAISTRRLHLVEAAIAEHDGTTEFFLCRTPDTAWSTLEPDVARNRTAEEHAVYETVQVVCRPFETILREHGVPYYLKIDIEGSDVLCLRALHAFGSRPRYVSLEIMRERAYEDLCELVALGYSEFKLLNQALNEDPETAGAFGEDTPGRWLSLAELLPLYRPALERTGRGGVWFDVHARRAE
jgi:FkbM family methyltransferase